MSLQALSEMFLQYHFDRIWLKRILRYPITSVEIRLYQTDVIEKDLGATLNLGFGNIVMYLSAVNMIHTEKIHSCLKFSSIYTP